MVLFGFDLTDRNSFDNCKRLWVPYIEKATERYERGFIPRVLVGHKSDLIAERKVRAEEGQALAVEIGAVYHETSAVTGEGVSDCFLSLALLALQRKDHEEQERLALLGFRPGLTHSYVLENNNIDNSVVSCFPCMWSNVVPFSA